MSERRALLACALLLLGCAKQDATGTRLVVTFERADGTPLPQFLRVSWAGDGEAFGGLRAPKSGNLSDSAPLGTFEISVRPGATFRTVVARGYVDETVVAEGAMRTSIQPDVANPITLILRPPGLDPDGDGDNIPDSVDDCRGEANPGQGPCQLPTDDGGVETDTATDTEAQADMAPPSDLEPVEVGGPPPPDAGATEAPPPAKLTDGMPCLAHSQCESNNCPVVRADRRCAAPAMVYVPGGLFAAGCLTRDQMCDADEQPGRNVTLKAFQIDKLEVAQAEYQRCVEARACATPQGFDPAAHPTWPATNLSWAMADAYCRWANKRLPTEAEWERAARGLNQWIYPWGDEAPGCKRAQFRGCGPLAPVPVGQQDGVSLDGAEDMAGNVAEWVADWYSATYYSIAPLIDPPGPATGTAHVLRGGGYDSQPKALRDGARASGDKAQASAGVRCAK
jgi:formylglycine-generating enzyme required for sulfatase activity